MRSVLRTLLNDGAGNIRSRVLGIYSVLLVFNGTAWLWAILAMALVLATAWSVFTALVVPRVTSSPAMRMLARVLGGSARAISPKLPNYEARDRVLSFRSQSWEHVRRDGVRGGAQFRAPSIRPRRGDV